MSPRPLDFLARLPRLVGIALIRVYQWTISPWLGSNCRFEPSCSRYACTCLEHHGLMRGSWLTAKRLGRCHPWHEGGYDPAPLPSEHRARALESAHEPHGEPT